MRRKSDGIRITGSSAGCGKGHGNAQWINDLEQLLQSGFMSSFAAHAQTRVHGKATMPAQTHAHIRIYVFVASMQVFFLDWQYPVPWWQQMR